MSKISSYHLKKFVLASLDDQLSKDGGDRDWGGWFASVSRMFNGAMPLDLIAAMKSAAAHGNAPPFCSLCEEELKRADARACKEETRRAQRAEREAKWIERRDAGNRRALEERIRASRMDAEAARRIKMEIEEAFVAAMLPTWAAQLNEFRKKRDQDEISFLLRSSDILGSCDIDPRCGHSRKDGDRCEDDVAPPHEV